MSTEVASTGRGGMFRFYLLAILRNSWDSCCEGVGNIGPEIVSYADLDNVVRVGDSDTGSAKFSTGRGGAGNIRSPAHPEFPSDAQDVVAQENPVVTEETKTPVSTGRGGSGNMASKRRSFIPSGLGGRLKKLLNSRKKEKEADKAPAAETVVAEETPTPVAQEASVGPQEAALEEQAAAEESVDKKAAEIDAAGGAVATA